MLSNKKVVSTIIKEGQRLLLNCESVILFGSILTSNYPNDIDIIATYKDSNLHKIAQEIEEYSFTIFALVGINLHITLLTIEEANNSLFYREVIKNKHHLIK